MVWLGDIVAAILHDVLRLTPMSQATTQNLVDQLLHRGAAPASVAHDLYVHTVPIAHTTAHEPAQGSCPSMQYMMHMLARLAKLAFLPPVLGLMVGSQTCSVMLRATTRSEGDWQRLDTLVQDPTCTHGQLLLIFKALRMRLSRLRRHRVVLGGCRADAMFVQVHTTVQASVTAHVGRAQWSSIVRVPARAQSPLFKRTRMLDAHTMWESLSMLPRFQEFSTTRQQQLRRAFWGRLRNNIRSRKQEASAMNALTRFRATCVKNLVPSVAVRAAGATWWLPPLVANSGHVLGAVSRRVPLHTSEATEEAAGIVKRLARQWCAQRAKAPVRATEVLGTGLSSDVWTLCRAPSDCEVAVKVVKRTLESVPLVNDDEPFTSDTTRELQIQAFAASRGLAIPVHSVIQCGRCTSGGQGRRPAVLMSKLPGTTLEAVIRQWPYGTFPNATPRTQRRPATTAGQLLRFLLDKVCAQIVNLHALGIVHGDAHDGNIWVTPGGRVLLFDFGRSSQLFPRRVRGGQGPLLDASILCWGLRRGLAQLKAEHSHASASASASAPAPTSWVTHVNVEAWVARIYRRIVPLKVLARVGGMVGATRVQRLLTFESGGDEPDMAAVTKFMSRFLPNHAACIRGQRTRHVAPGMQCITVQCQDIALTTPVHVRVSTPES